MPRELVLMPVLADVEMVRMPAELVLMPFFADVEMVRMPAELVLIDAVCKIIELLLTLMLKTFFLI